MVGSHSLTGRMFLYFCQEDRFGMLLLTRGLPASRGNRGTVVQRTVKTFGSPGWLWSRGQSKHLGHLDDCGPEDSQNIWVTWMTVVQRTVKTSGSPGWLWPRGQSTHLGHLDDCGPEDSQHIWVTWMTVAQGTVNTFGSPGWLWPRGQSTHLGHLDDCGPGDSQHIWVTWMTVAQRTVKTENMQSLVIQSVMMISGTYEPR